MLEPIGCDGRIFSSPTTALADFPVVIASRLVTDFAMGKVGDLDLIRRCKRMVPPQNTVRVSGRSDERICTNCTAKPVAFHSKPFPISDRAEPVQKLAACWAAASRIFCWRTGPLSG